MLARLSARARGRLLLPNERFRRSEPRCLGVRPQMTGRSGEGARCRPRRGERRWNGGRLCVFGASIFRSDGVCQLGTERIRRATSPVARGNPGPRPRFRHAQISICIPRERFLGTHPHYSLWEVFLWKTLEIRVNGIEMTFYTNP